MQEGAGVLLAAAGVVRGALGGRVALVQGLGQEAALALELQARRAVGVDVDDAAEI